MEEDLHGPGIDAKGAAFPGVNLYVQLGHGRDYAWSATSAGQDIIDTFAVPLCDATHYRFRGQCLPIEVLERKNAWTPNLADQTPAGSETLHAERTKLGLVAGRGTYKGKPDALHGAALDLPARGRLGHRLQPVQRARHDPLAPGLPARGRQHRLHVQLVLHRRQAHRLLQLGQQPGAGEGHDRPAADGVDQASGATSTPTSTPRATRRSPSIRRSSTSRCSRAGTTARPPATPAPTRTCSARSTARRCSIASSRCG